jgi:hypothetical protein
MLLSTTVNAGGCIGRIICDSSDSPFMQFTDNSINAFSLPILCVLFLPLLSLSL